MAADTLWIQRRSDLYLALTELCKTAMCTSLSLLHGYQKVLDAGKGRLTHEETAGPGARGGWMSMCETGVMPE